MTDLGVSAQRTILIGLMPLLAVVFWSGTSDPVNVPKATLATVLGIVVLVVSAVRVAVTRRLVVPVTPTLWAVVAFAGALALSTVTSDVRGASVAGVLGRSAGLLLYGVCVALFLVGLRVLDTQAARWLVIALMGGGLFAGSYGLLQRLHVDAVGWADVGISPVIGTFGNPDFESAYLGIVLPAAAWGALSRTSGGLWRGASAALVVLCLLVAGLSSSRQGLLAGGAGLGVLAIAVLLERGGRRGRAGLVGLAAVFTIVVGLVVAGLLAGVGPGQRITSAGSLTARKWYWGSALRMLRHRPLTGVGLDRYGAHYRQFRPAAAASVNNYSDAAHSVPLHMLGTGGLPLGLSYAAFVLLVGWALVQGLRRLEGPSRLLLGGLGGSWVAYQVQSLISIDQPALAVTHWLLGAAVVAVGSPPRLHTRLLPGAVQPVVRKGRAVATAQPPIVAVWSAGAVGICVVLVLLGLAGGWQSLKPLRASHASRSASIALARGDGNAAFDRMKAATRLAPYEQAYWVQQGRFLEQVKQPGLAAASYADGIRRDPRGYDVLLAGAILAEKQRDSRQLARYSRLLDATDRSGRWHAELGR